MADIFEIISEYLKISLLFLSYFLFILKIIPFSIILGYSFENIFFFLIFYFIFFFFICKRIINTDNLIFLIFFIIIEFSFLKAETAYSLLFIYADIP